MNASVDRVFYYHADATPLGGHLTHPFEQIVNSAASSALAQAGGHAESSISEFNLSDVISSGQAYSRTSGIVNKTTNAWTTLVTSVVENLNVLEVLTIDRVVSRVALDYPRDGDVPNLAFVGTQFVNVRLNGKIITPVLDFNLGSQPVVPGRFPDAPLLHDEGFLRNVIDRSEKTLKGAPDWLQKRYGWISSEEARAKKGYVLCSLVTGIDGAEEGQSFGNVLLVPGFGNIFFGELIVAQNSYRLTMVRVEMGCVAEGNLSVGSSFSNGRPIP